MKLQLQQGNVFEEYRLKNTIPPKPYLEVRQNNNVLGYARLGSSGRSKFTFNNMYIKNFEQYLFVQDRYLEIYDINLNFIRKVNNVQYPDGKIFTQNEDYIFVATSSDSSSFNFFKVDANIQVANNICHAYSSYAKYFNIGNNSDTIYNIIRKSSYYVSKFTNNSLTWQYRIEHYSQQIEIDGEENVYVYVPDEKQLKKISKDGNLIISYHTYYKDLIYVSKKNEIFCLENGVVRVYNNSFDQIYAITLPSGYGYATNNFFIHENGDMVFSCTKESNVYFSLINIDTKEKKINFFNRPYNNNDRSNHVLLDNDRNLYIISCNTISKINLAGKIICEIAKTTQHDLYDFAMINGYRR